MGYYPKSLTFGQKYVRANDILTGDYEVTEKIDGSQFSFYWKLVPDTSDSEIDGVKPQLVCRSKKSSIDLNTMNAMFKSAVDYLKTIPDGIAEQCAGYEFFGEAVYRRKHNVLNYGRTPKHNIILFSIKRKDGSFIGPTKSEFIQLADILDLEMVPVFDVELKSMEDLEKLLETESILGEVKIEGVVIKKYGDFWLGAENRKMLGAKFVSPKFKEVMTGKVKVPKVNKWEEYKLQYQTEARWQKAYQALAEAETLTHTKKDIGPLIKYVQQDIEEECKDEILEFLWGHFGKQLLKAGASGLATWYGQKLMAKTLQETEINAEA